MLLLVSLFYFYAAADVSRVMATYYKMNYAGVRPQYSDLPDNFRAVHWEKFKDRSGVTQPYPRGGCNVSSVTRCWLLIVAQYPVFGTTRTGSRASTSG